MSNPPRCWITFQTQLSCWPVRGKNFTDKTLQKLYRPSSAVGLPVVKREIEAGRNLSGRPPAFYIRPCPPATKVPPIEHVKSRKSEFIASLKQSTNYYRNISFYYFFSCVLLFHLVSVAIFAFINDSRKTLLPLLLAILFP